MNIRFAKTEDLELISLHDKHITMNMLYLLKDNRGKGYGKELVVFWEDEMRKLGYKAVMTLTASDEYSQHFYLKLGYRTIGGFMPEGDPYEIILSKHL